MEIIQSKAQQGQKTSILQMCPFSFLDPLPRGCVCVLQGGNPSEAEYFMGKAKEAIQNLKSCGADLRQMGQPNENVMRR